MSQVLRGPEARCAIEVLRTNSEAILAMLDSDCSVTLISHPLSWAEIGQQYKNGKAFFEFDKVWKPLLRQGPAGIEPYPLYEAVRKIIRGCFSEPVGFKGGSLDALMDVLPYGEHHLFTRESGFVGRFASVEDATMIASALKAVKPIIFSTAEEFLELAAIDQGVVLLDLDPSREWPATLTSKQAMGVMEMAKAKTKDKTKKVAKAEAKQRKADGPVAKARAIFEKMKDSTDSAAIIKACEEAGVNRGTATTQLGRWRKENGITVKRGGARKKATGENQPAATESPEKGKGKKKKGKDNRSPSLPASKTKGEKRHKPGKKTNAATKNETPSFSTSEASSPAEQSKGKTEAPAPATSPGTVSAHSTSAPAASTSTAASGPANTGAAPGATGSAK